MSIRNRITRKRRRLLLSSDAMHVKYIKRYAEDGCVGYCAEFLLHDDNKNSPISGPTKEYGCICIGDRNLAGVYQGAYWAYKGTLKEITERMGCTFVTTWRSHEKKHGKRIPIFHVSATIHLHRGEGARILFAKDFNLIDAYRKLWDKIYNERSKMTERKDETGCLTP